MEFAEFIREFIKSGVRYAKMFFGFFVLGVISLIVFRGYWLPSGIEGWRCFVGAVLGAAGVVAKLGWDGQTWSGKSLPEKLDRWFFRIFLGISFFLLV